MPMMRTAGRIASSRVISRRTHGLDPPVHEPFHHDLAGQRAGDRAALAAGQQGHREQRAGRGRAQQRRQRQIGDADPVGVRAEA